MLYKKTILNITLLSSIVLGVSLNIVFATILTNNFTNHSVSVTEGMEIFKYETETSEELDDLGDFNSQTISNGQFLAGVDDLEAIVDTDDFITLNHYGDNPPDTSATDWWDDDADSSTKYNWRYRQCFEIDHTAVGASTQTEYQILQRFDTAALVSAGKMNINGDDIRFLDSDENELDYYISRDMNTSDTHIWIQVDNIDATTTEDLCMYYGDVSGVVAAASDRDDTFTYPTQEDLYYAMWRTATGANANIASYTASNDVSYGGFSNTFAQYGVSNGVTIPGAATPISAEGPLSISFTNNATDIAAPISYAGTSFTYYARRGNDQFDILAPFGTANVTIQEADAGIFIDACGAGSTFSVASGTVSSVNCDIPNNRAFTVVSDQPIIVAKTSTTNRDSTILYPAERALQPDSGQYELWGVGSGRMILASSGACAGIQVHRSNGTTTSVDLTVGNNFATQITGGGGEGTGDAFHVVANCPIGAGSNADGDGGEETAFLPEQEWSDTYLIPEATQYVAAAAISTAQTCEILNPANTVIDTDISTGGNGSTQPSKIYFPSSNNTADVINFNAGQRVECPEPTYAYFEKNSTNDEVNFLSYIQARKFTDVEPVVENLTSTTEEGLYFESGFDSNTTATDPEAQLEWIIDTSSLANSEHTFWNEIDFDEIISDRTNENGVDAIEIEIAYGDPSPSCALATYTSVTLSETNLTSVVDGSPTFSTNTENTNRIQIPDEVSDSECLRIRINLRTGDEAYSPKLEVISSEYILPTLLEDQLNSPTLTTSGSTTDDRVRVLKITTPNTGVLNSTCELRYNSVSNLAPFTNADFEFYEIQNNTLNSQFDFPPFPLVSQLSGSNSICDSNNDLSLYFDHSRSAGVTENINLEIEQEIQNLNGPLSTRNVVLQVTSP